MVRRHQTACRRKSYSRSPPQARSARNRPGPVAVRRKQRPRSRSTGPSHPSLKKTASWRATDNASARSESASPGDVVAEPLPVFLFGVARRQPVPGLVEELACQWGTGCAALRRASPWFGSPCLQLRLDRVPELRKPILLASCTPDGECRWPRWNLQRVRTPTKITSTVA